jgi:hypothetical protein
MFSSCISMSLRLGKCPVPNIFCGEETKLEPHHPSVSLMDVQKDFGENERDKDNQHRVELALLGFNCQAANRPHSPMIN